jgi:threonine dehydrogenase-like Zn-dependent dehydrogenase
MGVLRAPIPKNSYGVILGVNRIAALTQRIMARVGFTNIHQCSVEVASNFQNEFDFIIETEANASAFQAILDAIKVGGQVILKSRPAAPIPLNLSLAVKKEISFYAVSYGSFEAAISLINSSDFDIDDLLGPSYPLEQFEAAFAASEAHNNLKIFFEF